MGGEESVRNGKRQGEIGKGDGELEREQYTTLRLFNKSL